MVESGAVQHLVTEEPLRRVSGNEDVAKAAFVVAQGAADGVGAAGAAANLVQRGDAKHGRQRVVRGLRFPAIRLRLERAAPGHGIDAEGGAENQRNEEEPTVAHLTLPSALHARYGSIFDL